jgi:hypothetical protein
MPSSLLPRQAPDLVCSRPRPRQGGTWAGLQGVLVCVAPRILPCTGAGIAIKLVNVAPGRVIGLHTETGSDTAVAVASKPT